MRRRKYYEVWNEYNEFIKSLHLNPEKEEKKESKFLIWIKKILIIFCAALFTTISFKFFIDPNGLYNSGANGLIQIVSKYLSINYFKGKDIYYYFVIPFNIFVILAIELFLPGNFSINSTAFIYVLSQYIWSEVFKFFSLNEFIFNKLNQKTWSGQPGLSIPFYFLIAVISAWIHAFGYSLIYQAKSSPGGFDIMTSTLSRREDGKEKKNRISVSFISKILSFSVLIFITFFSFIYMEDNPNLVSNKLIQEIEKENETNKWNFIKELSPNGETELQNREKLIEIIEKASKEKNSKELLVISSNFKKSLNLPENYDKDINLIIYFLKKGKVGISDYYKEKMEKNEKDFDEEKKEEISNIIKSVEETICEKNLRGYLKYVTNDVQLIASVLYIFVSSHLLNEFFPKEKILKVEFIVYEEAEEKELSEILKDYRLHYFREIKNKNGEKCTLISCLITKWNYQLISDKIGKFEKVAIWETDEKS